MARTVTGLDVVNVALKDGGVATIRRGEDIPADAAEWVEARLEALGAFADPVEDTTLVVRQPVALPDGATTFATPETLGNSEEPLALDNSVALGADPGDVDQPVGDNPKTSTTSTSSRRSAKADSGIVAAPPAPAGDDSSKDSGK